MQNNTDVIRCSSPAEDFAEGFPIGNGRIGGMVLGKTACERIALNHDLLWRRSFSYQEHYAAEDIKKAAELCLEGKYCEAESVVLKSIPVTGYGYYINPYVPVGDLYISERHSANTTEYRRELDMDTGIALTEYRNERGVLVTRESTVSWQDGVLAVRITADHACGLEGMVSLSRLGDEECVVDGSSAPGKIQMDGEFEEGLRFAVRVKILQRGGRLKGGRKSYIPYENNCPSAWASEYVYSHEEMFDPEKGCSCGFDHSDEVLILVSIATMDESADPGRYAEEKLEKFTTVRDGDRLFSSAAEDHQALYRRMSLKLGNKKDAVSADVLLDACVSGGEVLPEMAETLFNFSRYLSIASGRPQKEGELAVAPINLQGIWQQDLRPAWDSDYHPDLNIQMCYWNINAYNLPELMYPMLELAERIAPQARAMAEDIFGTKGYCVGCMDYFGTGSLDNVGVYSSASFSAWICQVMWQNWRYTADEDYLGRLYKIMKEIGGFFEEWLIMHDGKLIMPFGSSPEMPALIDGRQIFLASEGSFDMELIYDLFAHLTEAAEHFGDTNDAKKFAEIKAQLMLPIIGEDGAIQEWLEDHTIAAPEHRHRSHLVGLIPGERISPEITPEYAEAAWKALQKRHEYGFKGATSFTPALDGQICTRLLRGEDAYNQLKMFVKGYLLPNLLSVTNDYDGKHGGIPWFVGQKLYQIEAQLAIGGVILEMIFQSRQGILRFLPALPKAYPSGSIAGAAAEGGFTVEFTWAEGKAENIRITSSRGEICTVKLPDYANDVQIEADNEAVSLQKNGKLVSFETVRGKTYTLIFK